MQVSLQSAKFIIRTDGSASFIPRLFSWPHVCTTVTSCVQYCGIMRTILWHHVYNTVIYIPCDLVLPPDSIVLNSNWLLHCMHLRYTAMASLHKVYQHFRVSEYTLAQSDWECNMALGINPGEPEWAHTSATSLCTYMCTCVCLVGL